MGMRTYNKPCRNGHPSEHSRTASSGRRVCRDCERAGRNRYYNAHRERAQINALNDRRLRHEKRQDLLAFLGNKCVKCGFFDWRALQIDHINGGGTREMRQLTITQRYKKIKEHPESYQLLCANCNAIKVVEKGEKRHVYPL